jgi:hypothetical protein
MPYTRLSLADFTAKYTAFTTLTEPPYAAWATDAEADITDRYGSYQQRATELMTAHYLALQTIGMDEVSGLIATGCQRRSKSRPFGGVKPGHRVTCRGEWREGVARGPLPPALV